MITSPDIMCTTIMHETFFLYRLHAAKITKKASWQVIELKQIPVQL